MIFVGPIVANGRKCQMRFRVESLFTMLVAVAQASTLSLSLLVPGSASAKVGVTSAADGDPLGKPPNDNERVLRIGIDIQANELITTGAADRAHLVFLDGSSLTVGPNARLAIDKFVFDPGTNTGDIAISATKGVFRLVGGKISKSNAIKVTTPTATIGIRGGIVIFEVTSSETVADFMFGKSMTVSSAGVTQTATRPGSQIVAQMGQPPAAPFLIKPGSLNAVLGQLEGRSSNRGGSQNPDEAVRRSGLPNSNSNQTSSQGPPNLPPNPNDNALVNALSNVTSGSQNIGTTTVSSSTSGGASPTHTIVTVGSFQRQPAYQVQTFNSATLTANPNPANNQTLAPTGSVSNQVATLALQSGDTLQVPWLPGQAFSFSGVTPYGRANGVGFVDSSGQFFAYSFAPINGQQRFTLYGGTPTAAEDFPQNSVRAQQLVNLMLPGALPFASSSVGGDPQLQGAASVSALNSIFGTGASTSKGLQVTVSVAGVGTDQKSYIGVFIADFGVNTSNNAPYSAATYAGSYRTDSSAGSGRLASMGATANTGQGTAIYGPTGQYMVYTPDGIQTANGQTSRITGAALDQSNPAVNTSYYPVTAATPADQVPPTLGQSRSSQTLTGYAGGLVDTYGSTGVRGATGVPQALLAQPTDVSITTQPANNQATGSVILRGYNGPGATPLQLTLQLGGSAGSTGPTSAFIDNNNYAMVSASSSSGRQSTVRDGENVYSLNANSLLASANSAAIALPNGGSCTCEYLSWGWWSTTATLQSGPAQGTSGQVNLGTYVTGTLANAVQMPQTGTASYTGFMVGNVNNAGASYIGSGSYQMNWNFGARTGTSNMTFDGMSYGGTASTITGSGGVQFNGSMAGGGRNGTYSGSFFSAPGDAAKYQAGTFSIGANNTPYKASGIFAGQR